MPHRGDTVVPLEAALTAGGDGAGRIRVVRPYREGRNVAESDEDVRRGELVASAGDIISPGDIGTLVAAGLGSVPAVKRPRVLLVATGPEVEARPPGHTPARPKPGRVFNSSGAILGAELTALGVPWRFFGHVSDDDGQLRKVFRSALDQGEPGDVIISTGGVSVGRGDRVIRTWLDLGARRLVGRIDIKPGGPFFAGHLRGRWLIGLSGTPLAALVIYHLLVRPLLLKLAGHTWVVRPVEFLPVSGIFPKPADQPRALWVEAAPAPAPDSGRGPAPTPAPGAAGPESRRGPGGPVSAEADDPGSYGPSRWPGGQYRGTYAARILTGSGASGRMAPVGRANGLLWMPRGTPPLEGGEVMPVLRLDLPENASRPGLPETIETVSRPRFSVNMPRRAEGNRPGIPGAGGGTPAPMPVTGGFSVPVVAITGPSDSGKTEAASGLIERLADEGFDVLAVKHAAHGFTLDRPGTDSSRLARAGAAAVWLAGPGETAVRFPHPGTEPSYGQVIRRAVAAWIEGAGRWPHMVIVEGYSGSPLPRIEVGARPGDVRPWGDGPPVIGRLPAGFGGEELDGLVHRIKEMFGLGGPGAHRGTGGRRDHGRGGP